MVVHYLSIKNMNRQPACLMYTIRVSHRLLESYRLHGRQHLKIGWTNSIAKSFVWRPWVRDTTTMPPNDNWKSRTYPFALWRSIDFLRESLYSWLNSLFLEPTNFDFLDTLHVSEFDDLQRLVQTWEDIDCQSSRCSVVDNILEGRRSSYALRFSSIQFSTEFWYTTKHMFTSELHIAVRPASTGS